MYDVYWDRRITRNQMPSLGNKVLNLPSLSGIYIDQCVNYQIKIAFTCVFSHVWNSTTRSALAIASLASNNANRIPIQLLQTIFNQYIVNNFCFCLPRSITKRKKCHRMLFSFLSCRKSIKMYQYTQQDIIILHFTFQE